jgi:hypothetical protein
VVSDGPNSRIGPGVRESVMQLDPNPDNREWLSMIAEVKSQASNGRNSLTIPTAQTFGSAVLFAKIERVET